MSGKIRRSSAPPCGKTYKWRGHSLGITALFTVLVLPVSHITTTLVLCLGFSLQLRSSRLLFARIVSQHPLVFARRRLTFSMFKFGTSSRLRRATTRPRSRQPWASTRSPSPSTRTRSILTPRHEIIKLAGLLPPFATVRSPGGQDSPGYINNSYFEELASAIDGYTKSGEDVEAAEALRK